MYTENPLVSIIVVTYNSSKYVLETLESTKNQTYQNIELIVTDDCSKDNTVKICRDWLQDNKERFVRTKLITMEANTGISPNINRGFNAAQGEWVKFVAGDDVLINSCITNFIKFCDKTPTCKIVFGKMIQLQNSVLTELQKPHFFELEKQKQVSQIYKGSGLQAPASFIKRSFLKRLGGFDEQYKFIEDLPLWIKITKTDEEFYFIDEFVIKYRIHDSNICLPNSTNYTNTIFYYDNEKILIREILPYLLKNLFLLSLINYLNYIIVMRLIIFFGNRNGLKSKFLNLLILRTTFRRLKRHIRFSF
jgi:alpha-1,3-rhamnosyltransferase